MPVKRRKVIIWALALLVVALPLDAASIPQARAATNPPHLAFLGVRLQNDNEKLEPTTDAERNRISAVAKQFTSAVASSGTYAVTPVTAEIQSQIANGQPVGSCGGCEAAFGKQLGADRVAWITVQKVSNLILNMNLYLADPATDKLTFVKSVDIRGNTDESWSRSLKYLLDNYFFVQKS
jgi:hypothetical protein